MAKFMTIVDSAIDKAVASLMLSGLTQETALKILRDVIIGRLAQLK